MCQVSPKIHQKDRQVVCPIFYAGFSILQVVAGFETMRWNGVEKKIETDPSWWRTGTAPSECNMPRGYHDLGGRREGFPVTLIWCCPEPPTTQRSCKWDIPPTKAEPAVTARRRLKGTSPKKEEFKQRLPGEGCDRAGLVPSGDILRIANLVQGFTDQKLFLNSYVAKNQRV